MGTGLGRGRRRLTGAVVGLVAVAGALAAPPARAGTSRTETQRYVTGGATFASCADAPSPASMVGSNCFSVATDETSASIQLRDQSGLPTGGSYAFSGT